MAAADALPSPHRGVKQAAAPGGPHNPRVLLPVSHVCGTYLPIVPVKGAFPELIPVLLVVRLVLFPVLLVVFLSCFSVLLVPLTPLQLSVCQLRGSVAADAVDVQGFRDLALVRGDSVPDAV